MSRDARDTLVVLAGLALLVGVAVAAGWVIHRPGMPTILAAFGGALAAVGLLIVYGLCYRLWARAFWGAPFACGDRLQVAKGEHAGKEGRVTGLGQGTTVHLELLVEGESSTVELPWGSVRRIVAVQHDAGADE